MDKELIYLFEFKKDSWRYFENISIDVNIPSIKCLTIKPEFYENKPLVKKHIIFPKGLPTFKEKEELDNEISKYKKFSSQCFITYAQVGFDEEKSKEIEQESTKAFLMFLEKFWNSEYGEVVYHMIKDPYKLNVEELYKVMDEGANCKISSYMHNSIDEFYRKFVNGDTIKEYPFAFAVGFKKSEE